MNSALSTAATGMAAQETRLSVTANNIANVSTPGFKKSRAEFEDLMYQTLTTPGSQTTQSTKTPTGAEVGLGVGHISIQRMHTEGDLQQTGNALDLAVEGHGYFQVSMPDGSLAYTRAGAFRLDHEGKIVNPDGHPLSAGITVPPEAQSLTIGADGTVNAKMPNDVTPAELGKIEIANFANPSGLSAMGRNLFRETAASGTATLGSPGTNGLGTLNQGSLELANVKMVEEMMDLITGQRAYEANARVLKAADEMLAQSSQLR